MAYSITQTNVTDFGNMRVAYGTYTKLTGDTTGTLSLGFQNVLFANAVSNTAAVAAGISWSGGTLTFYGASGDTGGYWEAYGV
jgi:hypothetical protein